MNKRGTVKFLVDIEKACLMTNFEKRNWVRGSEGTHFKYFYRNYFYQYYIILIFII